MPYLVIAVLTKNAVRLVDQRNSDRPGNANAYRVSSPLLTNTKGGFGNSQAS